MMFAFRLRPVSLFSSLSQTKNAVRLPPSASLFAFRQITTSRVNHSQRFVYLGNLPFSLEIEDIKIKAEKFGPLESINIPDDESGRPAGFANVEFVNPEDAKGFHSAALETGLSFEGRTARVELVEEAQTERIRGRFASSHSSNPPSSSLFIGQMSFETQEDEIREVFSPYGTITRINIAKDRDGYRRGFAHVEFETVEQASSAMEALKTGIVLTGRPVNLDYAPPLGSQRVNPPSDTLFFLRYPGNTADLREALSSFESAIVDIRLMDNQKGFIEFRSIADASAAKEAMELQKETPAGHPLNLFFSKPLARARGLRNNSGNMRRSNSYGGDW